MASHDKVRLISTERIDKPDADDIIDSPFLVARSVVEDILTGSAGYILDGFAYVVGGTDLDVTRGTMVSSEDLSGTPSWGQIIRSGTSTKSVAFAAAAVQQYEVAVRFTFSQASYSNRVMWDSDVPEETLSSIATRYSAQWQIDKYNVGAVPAGWTSLARVDWDGAVLTILEGKRDYLFEGVQDTVAKAPLHDWGGGVNDRDPDRAQYGVKTLRGFARAVLRQIADIIGVADGVTGENRWFAAVPTPLSDLKKSGSRKLSLSGASIVTGNLIWDVGAGALRNPNGDTTTYYAVMELGHPTFLSTAEIKGFSARFDSTHANAKIIVKLLEVGDGDATPTLIQTYTVDGTDPAVSSGNFVGFLSAVDGTLAPAGAQALDTAKSYYLQFEMSNNGVSDHTRIRTVDIELVLSKNPSW